MALKSGKINEMKFLTLILILSLNTFPFKGKFWVKFSNKKVEISRYKDGFISKDCEDCLAKRSTIKKVNIDSMNKDQLNPYSLACKKVNGKVIIGKLYNKNSQGFCLFEDKSLVSLNCFTI